MAEVDLVEVTGADFTAVFLVGALTLLVLTFTAPLALRVLMFLSVVVLSALLDVLLFAVGVILLCPALLVVFVLIRLSDTFLVLLLDIELLFLDPVVFLTALV